MRRDSAGGSSCWRCRWPSSWRLGWSAAGFLAAHLQEEQIRQAYAGRVLTIARSLAELPAVATWPTAASIPPPPCNPWPNRCARPPARSSSSSPTATASATPTRTLPEIGPRVSTDPSVALAGDEFVGTETGTLGSSLRAKVPVRESKGWWSAWCRSACWRAGRRRPGRRSPPWWVWLAAAAASACRRRVGDPARPAADLRPGAGGDRRAATDPRRHAARRPRRCRGAWTHGRAPGAGQR